MIGILRETFLQSFEPVIKEIDKYLNKCINKQIYR